MPEDNSVSLKEFILMQFDAQEKALILASQALGVRLDSLNEWRLQNKDERSMYRVL